MQAGNYSVKNGVSRLLNIPDMPNLDDVVAVLTIRGTPLAFAMAAQSRVSSGREGSGDISSRKGRNTSRRAPSAAPTHIASFADSADGALQFYPIDPNRNQVAAQQFPDWLPASASGEMTGKQTVGVRPRDRTCSGLKITLS